MVEDYGEEFGYPGSCERSDSSDSDEGISTSSQTAVFVASGRVIAV